MEQKRATSSDNLDFIRIAKSNSKDIFDKIRITIILELIISTVMVIIFITK